MLIMKKLFFLLTIGLCLFRLQVRAEFVEDSFDFTDANQDGITLYYSYLNGNSGPVKVVCPEIWVNDYDGQGQYVGRHSEPLLYTATIIRVPAQAQGHTVTTIGDHAFMLDANLTRVELPASVTHIEREAFSSDSLLQYVNLESVEWIGEVAFQSCVALDSVYVPASAADWAMSVFQYAGLSRIVFDEALTAIPERMFFGCENLQTVVLPDALTKVGLGAFAACDSIASVQLSASLDTLEMGAFMDAPLTELTLPASLRYIGAMAFRNTENLPYVTSHILAPAGVLEDMGLGVVDEETPQADRLTIRVPVGTAALYLADEVWSKFNIVEQGDPTGFEEQHSLPASPAVRKEFWQGRLLIIRQEGTTYDPSGAKVK